MSTTRTNTAVWLEKYQRWQIKVQKEGKRKTFTCPTPGRRGQIECNGKADKWLKGSTVQPKRVKELYDEWIAELKLTTSTSHWLQYYELGNRYVKPAIGMRMAGAVTEQHLQDIILGGFKCGKGGKPLSHKSLLNIKGCLIAFMKYSRKCGQTTLFPENLYVPKGAAKGERRILQPESMRTLLHDNTTTYNGKIIREPYINAFRFSAVTGLRPGEVLALGSGDIDGETVNVRGSFNVYHEHTQGKNKNAVRTFAMNRFALDIVQDQARYKKSLNLISPYLFCDENGHQIKPDSYYRHWRRYTRHHGIEHVSTYELRHTFISYAKTVSLSLLKPIVGHSVRFDTIKTYAHEVDGEAKEAATQIEKALSDALKL